MREQFRAQSTRVVLTAVAAGALLVVGVFVLAFAGGEDRAGSVPTRSEPAAEADDSAPVLPLDLASVGFENGTVEPTAATEGPGAVSYCNRRPTADGLLSWDGNRLTAADNHQRVSQIVARFRSSLDADIYLNSSVEITDCERWVTGEDELEFTVTGRAPRTLHGDDTRILELQKLENETDPALFLETVLVRSGRDVLQLTFVSANRRDLTKLEPLTDLAVAELGF
jgi:hypothetical protein